jgi:hypothetical protein
VVAPPGVDDIDELIAQAKSAKLAAVRADGDAREILFEEPEILVTGVPRSDDFGNWKYEHVGPQYPDRYAATSRVLPRRNVEHIVPEPPEPTWKPILIQVVAPDEKSGHPGTVIEAE